MPLSWICLGPLHEHSNPLPSRCTSRQAEPRSWRRCEGSSYDAVNGAGAHSKSDRLLVGEGSRVAGGLAGVEKVLRGVH